MRKLLFYLSILLSHQAYAQDNLYQEIEDQSGLEFLNPSLSQRKTAKLFLSNGMKAYLISDPEADQSAASVAVATGSWQDLDEHPGTAHLLEHMLFMGSEKYPSENDFWRYILDGSGKTNAFTDDDRTAYFFSINNDHFEGALDRFSHFFIDPLLPASGLSRELHAVDQEHAKNIEHDGWRMYMIQKEIGNAKHPNAKFSTGNSETLGAMPQETLKKWHQDHYSADRMHLVLYSNLPIEELKTLAAEKFSEVPRRQTVQLEIKQSLSSAQQKGHYIYINPIQSMRKVSLRWELPEDFSNDTSKSAELVSHAIQRGQKRSLLEKLKRENLAEGLTVHVEKIGGKAHTCLSIDLLLTENGLKNFESAITYTFEALSGLKMTGVPAYLFHEMQTLAQLNYEHQPRQDAFQYIMHHGSRIMDEELATYPKQLTLASNYDAQKVNRLIRHLTPSNCQFYILANPLETGVELQKKEKWLGGEYAIRKVPDSYLNTLASVYPNSDIKLANPNPFLPTKLTIVESDYTRETPAKILEDKMGKVFYSPCSEFAEPKVVYRLHLQSPLINASAQSKVLGDMYLHHITDELDPVLKCASAAGIKAKFDMDEKNRLSITVYGFSDKANLLLEEIVKQMPSLTIDQKKFETYYDCLARHYQNGQRVMPFMQALDYTKSMLLTSHHTRGSKGQILKNITFEDFQQFEKDLTKECYYEVFLSGNLDLKQAESIWMDIHHLLYQKAYPPHLHPPRQVLSLPSDSSGPYMITESTPSQGNAAFLVIDQGNFSLENAAAQSVLSAILSEAFFSELRTKQKTAYIAKSFDLEKEKHLYQVFSVQSNTHQPQDLIHRFELFLETFLQELPFEMTGQRFESIKKAQIVKLENLDRNLYEKSALLDLLAFDYSENFSLVDQKIEALKTLQYEEFVHFTKSTLSRNNRKRLAILLEGKIPDTNQFVYETIAPRDLVDRNSYERVDIVKNDAA